MTTDREANIQGLAADPSAFVRWACKAGYDMTSHPLHFLFLNERTAAARDGWKAAVAHYDALAAAPSRAPSSLGVPSSPSGSTLQPPSSASASIPNADTLCQRLQQRCSDWGVYWRASDAHGVDLSLEQAIDLLRDALGVEVEIAALPPTAYADGFTDGASVGDFDVRIAGPDDVIPFDDELAAHRHANAVNQAYLADCLKNPNPMDQVLCVATVHARGIGAEGQDAQRLGAEPAEPGHEVTRPDDTSRAQEERMPLNEEQIAEIVLRDVYEGDESIPYRHDWTRETGIPFARAIERAHGITSPDAQEAHKS
jgi:hypothetical protein